MGGAAIDDDVSFRVVGELVDDVRWGVLHNDPQVIAEVDDTGDV